MKWPEGVRKSGGGWRAVIMLDDGELLELGVWGLKPDAIEAYNWHLAWLGLDRPLLPMPEDPGDQQRKLMDRLGISYVMTPLGRKFPTTTNERKAKWLRT
jgi:hypothetical protein